MTATPLTERPGNPGYPGNPETPQAITTVEQLDDHLSAPTPAVVDLFRRLEGDVVLLGVAGKMGPTLGRMARRAIDEAGANGRKVIGVSRFSNADEKDKLESW